MKAGEDKGVPNGLHGARNQFHDNESSFPSEIKTKHKYNCQLPIIANLSAQKIAIITRGCFLLRKKNVPSRILDEKKIRQFLFFIICCVPIRTQAIMPLPNLSNDCLFSFLSSVVLVLDPFAQAWGYTMVLSDVQYVLPRLCINLLRFVFLSILTAPILYMFLRQVY